ncbi:ImmA/IrrE family metallo-endopeptidase [Vibrio harveyi]|uniref:ImmA/IrrE family metallo-endopeptidase n=1 Tax=Vibrio harveyi TaxID=669 RepID=UPI001C966522|nr:ImmA/IrrE family metallo-endopeptidase [Vibrio harveyi]MBY6239091.1 ImmA/IrrE family metallo-endopeptidase [Vibrio harveyi]
MSKSTEWTKLSQFQKSVIEKQHSEMPVKLGQIAKDLGLVVKKTTLTANISGQIKEEQDGTVNIKINRHDVKTRQRYTLAHEISHFLLHRHLLKDGITDDVLYRSSQSTAIEREADRLAADIIMPMEHVLRLKQLHATDKKGELLYEAIAEDMAVSAIALKNRLSVK